jgi:uncharacterized repeat protein (TIGR02543 family)
MRRPIIAVSSLVLVFSGLGISPANAATYDPGTGNGEVSCTVAGSISITNYVVSNGATCEGSVVVPIGVTAIGDSDLYYPFQGNSTLTNIEIPQSVTDIGFYSFNGASALESIVIPDGVTTIREATFANATGLKSVVLPMGLTTIERAAFSSTNSLQEISIPASVTSIEDFAFYESGLTSVYLFGNAPTVGTNNVFAFMGAFGSSPIAYIKSSSSGFPAIGSRWAVNLDGNYGLTVEIGAYEASYNSNGGSAVSTSDFIRNGSIASAPTAPTRSGYTFNGWSATDGGSAITFPYSPAVNSDITLFAKWTSNTAPTESSPSTNAPATVATKSTANLGKSIRFSTSSKVLTTAHKKALKKSVKASGKDATYVVTGTAGFLPGVTKAQVKKLAKVRANIVKAYLVKLGVKKTNITIKIKTTKKGLFQQLRPWLVI